MTTDIVKTPNCRSLIARDDQAFTGDFLNKVISSLGDLTLMPDQQPLPRKNLLLFLGENFRRNKILLFEGFCSCSKSFSSLAECRWCFRLHARPTSGDGLPTSRERSA